jgi:hypothetical protein
VIVPLLEGWRDTGRSPVERIHLIKYVISKGAHSLMDAYFSSKGARRAIEGIGLHRLITQTALFYLPEAKAQTSLLKALGPKDLLPQAQAEQPVLIETWRQGKELQIHLLNYAEAPQTAQVAFDSPVNGTQISPDFEGQRTVNGRVVNIDLDIYSVLLLTM